MHNQRLQVLHYTGADVTPQNYLNIITGNSAANCQELVLVECFNSNASDNVFLYFADHGGAGILGFPNDYLYASDLVSCSINNELQLNV